MPAAKSGHKNIGFAERSQQNYSGGGHKIVTIAEKHRPSEAGQFCSECGAWRGSLGLEPHPQMFIDHLVEICREIRRVLKPSGTFWLNLGDSYYGSHAGKIPQAKNPSVKIPEPPSSIAKGNWLQPKQLLMIPARVAIALQDDGWILRNDIIWHKPNHMPSSVKDRLTCAYEHVFLFAKARCYYFDLDQIRAPRAQSGIERSKYGVAKYHMVNGKPSISTKDTLERKIVPINPLGKNPGDVWEVDAPNTGARNKPPYKQNNPHLKRITEGREAGHPKGKNPGDLWRIPTYPFPGAHFAVFPPKLIEPIIKAGCPRWICSRCGKPRERITKDKSIERFELPKDDPSYRPARYEGKYSGGQRYHSYDTIGWSDCGCGEGWVGGVVLDPFAGSGTALRVARKLGRRFIGIEINQEYAAMCERRLRADTYKPPPEGVQPLTEIFENE